MNSSTQKSKTKKHLTVKEMCVFALLGTMMFCSKLLMEFLPNIHLLGMFTVVCAVVYRWKGLIPIYIYVFMNGIFSGFATWWIPYLYVWTVLWGMAMLIPQKIPDKIAMVVYPLICAFHGIIFGTLYAPFNAILMGFNFEQMMTWIVTGFTFDIIHCVGDFIAGLLILPVSKLLKKLSVNM